MRRVLYYTLLPVIALFFLFSCQKENNTEDFPEKSSQLIEAQKYFHQLKQEIFFLSLRENTKNANGKIKLKPNWQKIKHCKTDWYEYTEIPLNDSLNLTCQLIANSGAASSVKASTQLIMDKNISTKQMNLFVATIFGETSQSEQELSPFRFSGNRSQFNGYMIISAIDGTYLHAYQYENGVRFNVAVYSIDKYPSTAKDSALFFNFLYNSPLSKSFSEDSYCYFCHDMRLFINGHCSDCCSPLESIDGVVIRPDCPVCGSKYRCSCCTQCMSYVCECSTSPPGHLDRCPICFSQYCRGECSVLPGGGGSGGDGGEGGGGNGGNPPVDGFIDGKEAVQLTLSIDGNGSTSGSGYYAIDSYATITAMAGAGYKFIGWVDNSSNILLSYAPRYQLCMNENKMIKAVFRVEDSDCGKLKAIADNTALGSIIATARSHIKSNPNIEHSFMKKADGTVVYLSGEADKVSFKPEAGVKYTYRIHTHPNEGNCVSLSDINTFRVMTSEDYVYNLKTFFYGVCVNYSSFIMQVDDEAKFAAFKEITFMDLKAEYDTNIIEAIGNNTAISNRIYHTVKFLNAYGINVYTSGSGTSADGKTLETWAIIDTSQENLQQKSCLY